MKDLSLHILDLVMNSIAARAKRVNIAIKAEQSSGMLGISIEDNGSGMDDRLLETVADPFSTTRTTRRVGLGIPLAKASAERSGGRLDIRSEMGKGTTVEAFFGINNIDRPPIGDIAGTVADLAAAEPSVDIVLTMENGEKTFRFDSSEVRRSLGDEVPINEYAVVKWMRDYLNEGIKVIFGGVLNEVDS